MPRSDKAELTEFFWRHGDVLTWTVIINDPIYLSEPMVRSSDFRWAPGQQIGNYPCQIVTELDHEQGWLPHWLPGENPYLDLYSKTHDVIQEAARGGARDHAPRSTKESRRGARLAPACPARAGARGGGGGARRWGELPAARGGGRAAWTARGRRAACRARRTRTVRNMELTKHRLVCSVWRLPCSAVLSQHNARPAGRRCCGHRVRRSELRSTIPSRRFITPMPMTGPSVH